MNKSIKKALSAALSLAMVAGSMVLPIAAKADATPIFEGDTVLKEWKFDFGAADSTPEDGYTLVTPDRNYEETKDYGFLGISENSHLLGNRLDGFGNQEGQIIKLASGGGTGLNDAIGSVGAGGTDEKDGGGIHNDLFGNAADVYYPIRFALKADDETYYRVRATVTTLDPTADAEISVYTERKHPIITDTKVNAGETKTVEFSVRPTPIYYQKTDPQGAIADGMVNVCVVGENSAIASIEIQQVEAYPVFWVLGDSTVTDGNCSLPFFRLQNFTGVGTGLTKYLPRRLAMVNEGEGGLDANDSLHFNMVSSRIKSGDYLYVEYGHNHKTDGASGYKKALDKYYDLCHSKGAKLIIVSPIERINTWNSGNKEYDHTLRDFATTGEEYVSAKVAGGATDIAYVDLNQYSLDFYNKITKDNDDNAGAIKFYFQTAAGAGTDTTHPNDAGAENLAYEFFKAAKAVTDETQKAVLDGFLADMTDETPNLVSEAITSLGAAPNDAWPIYVPPVDYDYPVGIDGIEFDEDGNVASVNVHTQPCKKIPMTSYGIIIITVTDETGAQKGKIYAKDQVDNSTGYGPQTIENFTDDVTIGATDTYSAIVMKAIDSPDGLIVDEEANLAYSAVYKPTDIEKLLITNEKNNGIEEFDYYGATYGGDEPSTLENFNGWTKRGSAGIKLELGEKDDEKYVSIQSDGAKAGTANQGSFYVAKDFVKNVTVDEEGNETEIETDIGSTGRYLVSMDAKYVSGGGLEARFVTGNTAAAPWGSQSITLFTIGSGGVVKANGTEIGTISATAFTNIQYILDMDLGKAYVSVAGGDEKEIDIAGYQTESLEVSPSKLTAFLFGGDKIAFNIEASSLTVAKLRNIALPEYTLKAAANDSSRGTVTVITTETDKTDETTEPSEVSLMSVDGVSASYSFGNGVVVKSEGAAEVTVIAASYDKNGALKSIKSTPLTFTEAGEKTVSVAYGSKVMLWDSLAGMEPVADPVEASVETEDSDLKLNTVVKMTAEANEGYVFMGWLDEKGKTVSMDAEYTFRMRSDKVLIANFVKEPGIEDITNYSITAESTFIKAAAGTTTTMQLVNPVDAAGTPIAKATVGNVEWKSSDENVTVSKNGVVTIGENFTTGGADTKAVTITGVLNGITKTCVITTYSYAYYEEMVDGATNYDGTFMKIAGKTAMVFPGGNTVNKYTMTAPVALDKTTTVVFNHVWTGQNTCGQKRELQFKNSDGNTIFSVYYNWTGLEYNENNVITSIGEAVAKDKYTAVTAVIDPDAKTVAVSVEGKTDTLTCTLADDAKDIAGIDFNSASSVPGPEARALGISSIKITQ